LVDLGGVLYFDDPVELTYTYRACLHLKRLGFERDLGPTAILRMSRGTVAIPPDLSSSAWASANSLAWAETLESWNELAVPIPGAVEKLRALRPARIAIVANQPREMVPALVRDQVLELVDALVLDSLCGFSKPSPAIFQLAVEKLSVDPSRALMIGDRLDNDIEPAERLGIATLWLRRRLWTGDFSQSGVPPAWQQRFWEESQQQFGGIIPASGGVDIGGACTEPNLDGGSVGSGN
jgi:HAD superfamily hydrolase (TIGR01549 family)